MLVSRTSVEFICSMNFYECCISETFSPSRSVIPDPTDATAPTASTYSAISQLAPSCYEGGENPASSSEVKTIGGLNLLFWKPVNCCINFESQPRLLGKSARKQ